jgi:hypothetical protein
LAIFYDLVCVSFGCVNKAGARLACKKRKEKKSLNCHPASMSWWFRLNLTSS